MKLPKGMDIQIAKNVPITKWIEMSKMYQKENYNLKCAEMIQDKWKILKRCAKMLEHQKTYENLYNILERPKINQNARNVTKRHQKIKNFNKTKIYENVIKKFEIY